MIHSIIEIDKMAKTKDKKKLKKQSKKKLVQNKQQGVKWVFLLIAIVAGAIVFSTIFENAYLNYDDDIYVHENPLIRNLEIGKLFSESYASQYSPMAMTIMGIQYKISDSIAFIRFGSLLIHLLSVFFVFLIFRKLTKEDWMAGLIATLWAVHPMQVESVAWLSAAMKVGSYTLFYFISIWMYLKYLDDTKDKKWWIFSVLVMAISAMCKEQAVALPVMLLAIDYFYRRDVFSAKVLIEKAPYIVLSIIFGVVTLRATAGALDGELIADGGNQFNMIERFFLALHTIVAYVQRTIAPVNLSFFYTYPLKGSIPATVYLNAVLALGLIGAFVLAVLKDKRWLAFGLLVFFINVFFPTLTSLMSVRDVLMADRYMYVPILGLFFMFVYGLNLMKDKLPFSPMYLGFVLALFFAVLGFMRVGIFRDSGTLFSDVIKKESYSKPPLNPHLALAFNNRGIFRKRNGDTKGALADYEMAIRSNKAYPNAYLGRGNIYFNAGQDDKALLDYNKVAELDPKNGYNFSARGSVYGKRGEYEKALTDLNRAIEFEPYLVDAYSNRALIYLSLNKPAEAISDVDNYLRLRPNVADMIELKGVCYMRLGKFNEAVKEISRAIRISPRPSFYGNRAKAYEQLGMTAEAQADRAKAR